MKRIAKLYFCYYTYIFFEQHFKYNKAIYGICQFCFHKWSQLDIHFPKSWFDEFSAVTRSQQLAVMKRQTKETVCIHLHSIWSSWHHVKFYSCVSRLSDGLSSLDESSGDKLVEYKRQIAKLEQEQYEWQARHKELLSKQAASKGS